MFFVIPTGYKMAKYRFTGTSYMCLTVLATDDGDVYSDFISACFS